MKILLKRCYMDNVTIGTLTAGKLSLRTIEPPWRNNRRGVSCIPEGSYSIEFRHSRRFNRGLPTLINVPQRAGILIHSGNTQADSTGCILVGYDLHVGGGGPILLRSRDALSDLQRQIWIDDCEIEIIDGGQDV